MQQALEYNATFLTCSKKRNFLCKHQTCTFRSFDNTQQRWARASELTNFSIILHYLSLYGWIVCSLSMFGGFFLSSFDAGVRVEWAPKLKRFVWTSQQYVQAVTRAHQVGMKVYVKDFWLNMWDSSASCCGWMNLWFSRFLFFARLCGEFTNIIIGRRFAARVSKA